MKKMLYISLHTPSVNKILTAYQAGFTLIHVEQIDASAPKVRDRLTSLYAQHKDKFGFVAFATTNPKIALITQEFAAVGVFESDTVLWVYSSATQTGVRYQLDPEKVVQ